MKKQPANCRRGSDKNQISGLRCAQRSFEHLFQGKSDVAFAF
jgi:hypothetical protein